MSKYNSYYEQVERLTREFAAKQKAITQDPDLNANGKAKRINGLKEELRQSLAVSQTNFHKLIDDQISRLQADLVPVDSRAKLVKDAKENLFAGLYVDDNLRALLLVDELVNVRNDLAKNIFLMQVSHLDVDRTNELASVLYQQSDTEKLTWLRESVIFKERPELTTKVIDNYLNDIQVKIETPIQKLSREQILELERQRSLFDATIQIAGERNVYADMRRQPEENNEGTRILTLNERREFLEQRFSEQSERDKNAKLNPEEYRRLRKESTEGEPVEEESEEPGKVS